MAHETDGARQAILSKIEAVAPSVSSESNARAVLNLAEAYAWLVAPAQPHGGNAASLWCWGRVGARRRRRF